MATIKTINDTTYKIDKKSINEVEIGDVKQVDFYPQAKIKAWDNECNFSIRLTEDIKDATYGEKDGVVSWEPADKNKKVSIYEITTYSGCEEGALEFEVVFNKKPDTNKLTFTIQTKELKFFYQPELTEEEIKDGCVRDENIVGSYAVYHKTKKDNEYGTGKSCHIFRPWAEDATGKRVWCELYIPIADPKWVFNRKDYNKLYITIPQDFLDNAKYPVLVDPTIGNTSTGTSYIMIGSNQARMIKITAPDNLEVDNIKVLTKKSSTSGNIKGVSWDGSTGDVLTNGVSNSTYYNTTKTWYTLSYTTSPTCSEGSDYYFGAIWDSYTPYLYYDNGDSYSAYYDTSNSYSSPQSVGTPSSSTQKYSIYITYTVLASPEYDQLSFRWREDDGSESAASWLEAENTTHSGSETEARIRLLVDHTNSTEGADTFTIEYSDDATNWNELLTTSSGTPANSSLASDNFNDNSINDSIWDDYGYNGTGSGAVQEQNNRLELTATNTDDNGVNTYCDQFHGDNAFDVSVKVVASDANGGAKEHSLYAVFDESYSPFIYIGNLGYTSGFGTLFYNGSFSSNTFSSPGYPYYLRLKWDGSTVSSYYSTDGEEWTLVLSESVETSDTGLVGLYIYHEGTSGSTYTYFDDFTNNTIVEAPPVYIKNSSYLTNGSATTAQLTAPSGKTTGDFEAGDVLDTSDTSDAITVSSGSYTEYEWSLGFNDEGTYYFRIAELDTYTTNYGTYIYATAQQENEARAYSLWYKKDGVAFAIPVYETSSGFTESSSIHYNGEASYAELGSTGDADATDLRTKIDGTTYAYENRS